MLTIQPINLTSVNRVYLNHSKGRRSYNCTVVLCQLKLFVSSVLLSFFFKSVHAQQVISASGDHFYGSDFQLSWTVGEPVIEAYNSGDTLLTQGMHQSKLIISTIKEVEDLDVKIQVYPNPAVDHVQLEVESTKDEKLSYILYQMNGSVLSKGKLIDNQLKVPMHQYESAVYLLNLIRSNKILFSFKIIKKE